MFKTKILILRRKKSKKTTNGCIAKKKNINLYRSTGPKYINPCWLVPFVSQIVTEKDGVGASCPPPPTGGGGQDGQDAPTHFFTATQAQCCQNFWVFSLLRKMQ